MTGMETSRWWWFDSHNSSKGSPWLHSKRSSWLHSTLTELDGKTRAMLKLIEEDADSFAQRAEMYYKKRPELISMVEDFYRAYRSLAERYDQLKSETGMRLLTTIGSPFMSIKDKPQKLMNVMDHAFYSYSGTSDTEDYAESEVDDPEQEDETRDGNEIEEVEDPELENESEVDQGMKGDEFEQDNVIQVDQEVKEDSVSGTSYTEDYAVSEVDDPEQEDEIHDGNEIEEAEDPELENESEVDQGLKGEEFEQGDVIQVDQEAKEDSVSSEVCDDEIVELREEMEVEDPELENEIQVDQEVKEDSVSSEVCDDEIIKLREEIERLKEENMMQRNQLVQKDEEKREVIRQLSLTVGMLKDENMKMKKYIARVSPKKQSPFDLGKFKAIFRGTT